MRCGIIPFDQDRVVRRVDDTKVFAEFYSAPTVYAALVEFRKNARTGDRSVRWPVIGKPLFSFDTLWLEHDRPTVVVGPHHTQIRPTARSSHVPMSIYNRSERCYTADTAEQYDGCCHLVPFIDG